MKKLLFTIIFLFIYSLSNAQNNNSTIKFNWKLGKDLNQECGYPLKKTSISVTESSCIPDFFSFKTFIKKTPVSNECEAYYYIEITNNSKYTTFFTFRWNKGGSGSGADYIKPGQTSRLETFLGTNSDDIVFSFNKVEFSFSESEKERLDTYSYQINCNETVNSIENKLLEVKDNKEKKQRITALRNKAKSLPTNNKDSLLEKKSIYTQLSQIDEENSYSNQIENVEEEMRTLAKKELENKDKLTESIENEGLTVETKKEASKETQSKKEKNEYDKIKKEEEKKKTEAEEKAANYVKMRSFALDLVRKAQATSNMSEKIKLLKKAKSYRDYLTKEETDAIQDEIRGTVTREVSQKLASVDYGYRDRGALIMLNSGLNFLLGSYDSQFDGAIPLTLNTEFTITLGTKIALELQGEYSFNYVLRLGDAGAILSATGEDVEPLPESNNDIEKNTKYGKYYYALGLNFGKRRKFSFLLINQSIKYFHQEKENGVVKFELGTEEFLPTYGVGLVYNFSGKNRQELGRLMVSYSINDKNLDFINSDYLLNEISNINLKYEAGYGAFLFGIEYNNFNDKINDVNLSTIGIKLGVKIGL